MQARTQRYGCLLLILIIGSCTRPAPGVTMEDLVVRLELAKETDGVLLESGATELPLPAGTPLTGRVDLEGGGLVLHFEDLSFEGDALHFRGWGYEGNVGLDGKLGTLFASTGGDLSSLQRTAIVDGLPAQGVSAQALGPNGNLTIVRYELHFRRK